jgi:hypothetical protein
LLSYLSLASAVLTLLLYRQYQSALYFLLLYSLSLGWIDPFPADAWFAIAVMVSVDALIHHWQNSTRSWVYATLAPLMLLLFWSMEDQSSAALELSFSAVFFGLYRLWQPFHESIQSRLKAFAVFCMWCIAVGVSTHFSRF